MQYFWLSWLSLRTYWWRLLWEFLYSQWSDLDEYKPDMPGLVHSITNCNALATHMVFNEKDSRQR